MVHCPGLYWDSMMEHQSFFALEEHLERILQMGDPLELLEETVNFEHFGPWLLEGSSYGDGAKAGRPAVDSISMAKVLIL